MRFETDTEEECRADHHPLDAGQSVDDARLPDADEDRIGAPKKRLLTPTKGATALPAGLKNAAASRINGRQRLPKR